MTNTGLSRRAFVTAGAAAAVTARCAVAANRPRLSLNAAGRQPEIDLTKSQLFLDDFWIEESCRLERTWDSAEIFPEPVLRPEAPWEGRQIVMYGSVFRLGGEWRMYYCTYNRPKPSHFCLATSNDGLRWERPKLGICEYEGSRSNNILWTPTEEERHDGMSVCHDPEDVQAPFKLMFYCHGGKRRPAGEYVAFSKDGIRWRQRAEPVLTNSGDRTNLLPARDHRGKFVAYLRHADMMKLHRARTVWISESDDFIRWSDPSVILTPDLLDDPNTELYGMSAFRYEGIYLGMLERWYDNPDVIEVQLAWSHDGRAWARPYKRSAFIGPAYPWNRGWTTCANTAPVHDANQLWFYFGGRSGAHGRQHPHSYGVIGLATASAGRFAAIRADFKEGELITRPMTWTGKELVLNSSTTRYPQAHPAAGGGALSVEVRDEGNRPVAGFSGANRAAHPGNSTAAAVRWPGGRTMNELAGRRIRIAFHLQDARLYSFQSR